MSSIGPGVLEKVFRLSQKLPTDKLHGFSELEARTTITREKQKLSRAIQLTVNSKGCSRKVITERKQVVKFLVREVLRNL
jgi:hypothetical protein